MTVTESLATLVLVVALVLTAVGGAFAAWILSKALLGFAQVTQFMVQNSLAAGAFIGEAREQRTAEKEPAEADFRREAIRRGMSDEQIATAIRAARAGGGVAATTGDFADGQGLERPGTAPDEFGGVGRDGDDPNEPPIPAGGSGYRTDGATR